MASGARNVASFKGDIARFADTVKLKHNDAVRAITLEIYKRVTERTPVDTGRARAGWQITLNEPGSYVPDSGSSTPPIPDLSNITGQVFIVNNVSYIVYLEEGSSQQAPAGMVRITLAEIQAELDLIIRKMPTVEQNDFSNERKAIATAFKSGFVNEAQPPAALFPCRYENQPFAKRDGEPYADFSIIGGNTNPADIGGDMRRAMGVVFLRFFIPEDKGVESFNVAAGKFASIFDLKTFYLPNGIIAFACSGVATVGKDQASGMFQKNLRVNFRRDTFKTALFTAHESVPANASNVRFDGAGNIYFFNPDSGAFEKWEARGQGEERRLELVP